MINTKTKGELGRRIEYDVEHDLFHPQNVYSDEYITPTFIEYVQKLETSVRNLRRDNKELQEVLPKLDKENDELKYKLTKAKEIIKDLLSLCEGETDSKLVFTRAEQFLKEVEK